jgi:hypothetical protein
METLEKIADKKRFIIRHVHALNDDDALSLLTNLCKFITINQDAVLIKHPLRKDRRAKYREDAIRCRQNGDDALIIPDVFENENIDWWQWE